MKKKLTKLFFILLGVGLLSAFGVYMYVFHKPHRNIAKEKPAFILSGSELLNEFQTDENAAYKKYEDKAIQVTGTVQDVSISIPTATIMLNDAFSGISCAFDSSTVAKYGKAYFENLNIEEEITIKGKCDGYDMIMGVVLSRCVIVNDEN